MAYYYRSRKKKKVGIPSGILPKYRSMTYEELSATEAELRDELQRLNQNFTTSPEYKKIAAAESLIDDYFQKAEKLRNEALNKIKQLLDREKEAPKRGYLSELGITDFFYNVDLKKRDKEIDDEASRIMILLENEEIKNYKTPLKFKLSWMDENKAAQQEKQKKLIKLLNLEETIVEIHKHQKKINQLNKEKWQHRKRKEIILRLLKEKIPELKKTSKERQKIARLDAYDKKSREKGKTVINQIRKEHSQVFNCPYCNKPTNKNNAEVDHIIPVSGGGLSLRNNLVLVCRDCNQTKSDKSIMEFCATKGISMEELYKRLKSLGKKI